MTTKVNMKPASKYNYPFAIDEVKSATPFITTIGNVGVRFAENVFWFNGTYSNTLGWDYVGELKDIRVRPFVGTITLECNPNKI